ncbi:MAG: S41 family peptidase [Chloroflexota bacterium]
MSNRFRSKLSILIVVILTSSFSFAIGTAVGYQAKSVQAADEPSEFAIFWEAWDLVLAYFVDQDEIDFQQMTYGAIQGMLNSLGDQNHTAFLPPQVAQRTESDMEGSFEGIGAYVSSENGLFTIVSPILGSPAEEAGILPGDIVVAVDGEDIAGQAQWEVIDKIRGPAGSTVTLTVLHPDEDDLVDIDIIRDRIDINSVLWHQIPGTDLAYLQITQFAADTNRELEKALREIEDTIVDDKPIRGILLDLRNNPGGFLQQALLIASNFLPEDDVILWEQDARGNLSDYRSSGDGMAREIPIVVLINGGSASAAEILSGSLQANGRARLVGETTLGTGTVLRPFNLSDGSVLRLGVTNWLTPDQELIKGEGIVPNVVVEQKISTEMLDGRTLPNISTEELRTHEDRQFNMGLLFLKLAKPSAE